MSPDTTVRNGLSLSRLGWGYVDGLRETAIMGGESCSSSQEADYQACNRAFRFFYGHLNSLSELVTDHLLTDLAGIAVSDEKPLALVMAGADRNLWLIEFGPSAEVTAREVQYDGGKMIIGEEEADRKIIFDPEELSRPVLAGQLTDYLVGYLLKHDREHLARELNLLTKK